MTDNTNQETKRRRFLKAVRSSAGVAGVSALAGCSGDGDEGSTAAGGEGTTAAGGDGGTGTTGGSGETGEALPSYQYFNDPANYNAERHDAINLIGDRLTELGPDVNVEVFEWGTLYTRVRLQVGTFTRSPRPGSGSEAVSPAPTGQSSVRADAHEARSGFRNV